MDIVLRDLVGNECYVIIARKYRVKGLTNSFTLAPVENNYEKQK
jgi:hypothetical protein